MEKMIGVVMDTNRAQSFVMAFCGPFYQKGFEVKLPPEYAENLLQPFPDNEAHRLIATVG